MVSNLLIFKLFWVTPPLSQSIPRVPTRGGLGAILTKLPMAVLLARATG